MELSKKDQDLMEKTDRAIAELVHPKWDLQKAYNYYHGFRDAEQFRYLEENFGIGNPTAVEFTPLIKKHIDALVGEYLGTPIIPKVSCRDSETIDNINREKQLQITAEVHKYLIDKLQNQLLAFKDGKDLQDPNIKEQLDKLLEDLDSNFISQYEIAAQNVIEYIMQSRKTDIITKLKQLLLDILISGYNFYRVKPSVSGTNVEIEVLDPLNTFPDKNPESPYVKDSYRIVVRKWLTKTQILNIYGRDLSKEDRKTIEDEWEMGYDDRSSYYVYSKADCGIPSTDGLQAGVEVVPGYPRGHYTTYNYRLIPVYEVEWIDVDKKDVMQRYRTVRIGEEIHILYGKDDNVIRTKDNPSYCGLSVNGVYFTNRTPEPYSLMLACAHLQDKYDLLLFCRDNIIANSGTVGDYVDMSMLPTWLGTEPAERLMKYIAYKKSGTAPIDTAQEGRLASGQAPLNTIFNGYDDTVKAQAIQAIQMAIDSIEQTTSSITGVFRERLNGIEQRDAVTNIKQGVNNSFIITKQYYQQMDVLTAEMLTDALDIGKIVFKKGLSGVIVLGEKYQKIFTALPKYFTTSDFNIHVTTSTDIIKDLEYLKQIIPEFVKSQALAPDIIFEAITTKSLPELKEKVKHAMKKQKEENNQILQLQQQLQEMQQQLQQTQNQLQQSQQKLEALNEQKTQLEQAKLQAETRIKWYEAQTDRTYRTEQMKNDAKRVEIEYRQLFDGNPYNDKVRQR